MRLIALALLAAFLLAGCGGSGPSPGATAVGTWRGENGRTLESVAGPEPCDWESATFLPVTIALADRLADPTDRLEYVRDPEGLFHRDVVVPYDGSTALPGDAEATGFRLDELELWISPGEADTTGQKALYVVGGESVERWPRLEEPRDCA